MCTGRAHSATLRTAVASATAVLLALTVPVLIARAAACCSAPERFWQRGVVTKTTPDSIVVRFTDDGITRMFALDSMPLQNAARSLRRLNDALVVVGEVDGEQALLALGARVSRGLRLGVMVGVAGALLALAALVLGVGPRSLTLGKDGLYSSSKWQMLVWFGVLVVAYGATIVLRWWAGGIAYTGCVAIPGKLLILSGLSAFTFAAAKTIRRVKESRAAARARGGSPGDEKPAARPPRARFPADLVRDPGGPPDLGRFQMVVVTLLAVAVYVIRVFACLGQVELAGTTSLPDVDTTILGAIGISQGAYLAKKAVAPL